MKIFTSFLLSVFITAELLAQFSPTDLPGLTVWLRSDSLVVKDVNDNVSSWGNCVSGGVAFTQATGTQQPKWTGNVLNSRAVVRFDGVNDFLNAGDNYDLGTSSRTTFIVCKTNNTTTGSYYAKALAAGASNRLAFYHNASGLNILFQDNAASPQLTTLTPAPATYSLFSNTINRTSQQVQMYRSGNQVGTTLTGIQGASYNFNSTYRFLLGAYNNATDAGEIGYLNGDIAEVIIYDSSLPDSSRNKVEQYLRFKYAPQINLGPDRNVSYGFCPQQLKAGSGFTNYLWSSGSTDSTIAITQAGTYWVRASDAFGYVTSDTINVSFSQQWLLGSDTSLCQGSSLTASSSLPGPYSYLWSTGSTASSLNIGSAGTYWLQMTDTSGCTKRDTLVVQADNFASLASLGADTALCSGNTIGLQTGSAGAVTYNWSTGASTPSVAVNSAGPYSVTVVNTNGCVAKDTIQVSITGTAPTANFTADTVCQGSATSFTNLSSVLSPATITGYLWTFEPGQTGSSVSPSYTFSSAGIKTVSLKVTTNVGCSNTVSKYILVRQLPNAVIPTPLSSCSNSPFSFSSSLSSAAPGDALSSFNWNFGDGNTSIAPNPTHTYLAAGTLPVILTVTGLQGCSASDTETISVVSSAQTAGGFTLNSPVTGYITSGGNITFNWNSSSGATGYVLQVSANASFSGIVLQSPPVSGNSYTAPFTSDGLYYWRVSASNICGQVTFSNVQSFEILSPVSLGSLTVWLRSDSLVVKDVNDNVSSWGNCVSGGVAFTQAAGTQQPKWTGNVLNSMPIVRFDGVNDFLSAGDNYDLGTGSRTIFIVCKTNSTTTGSYYAKTLAANASNRLAFYHNASGLNVLFQDNSGNPQLTTLTPAPTTYSLFSNTINRTSQEVRMYSSGNQVGTTLTGIQGASYNFNSTYRFLLGAYNNATDAGEIGYLNGDIAEVIIYDAALSDSNRNKVEQYLRYKYAPQIDLGPDISVAYGFCAVPITAPAGFTNYLWSTGATGNSISVTKSGKYWVTALDIFGYATSDTIIVNFPGNIPIPDDTLCLGGNLLISSGLSGAYSYQWSNGATSAQINLNTGGTYSLVVTDTSGCILRDTIVVSVDSFINFISLGPDTSLCSGNFIGLQNVSAGVVSYNWSTGVSTPSIVVNSSGQYSLTVINVNGCIAIDTINVTVSGIAPTANFSADTVCFGSTTGFTDLSSATPPAAITSYLWSFEPGQTSTTSSPSYTFSSAGVKTVSLKVTTNVGCSGIIFKNVLIRQLPSAVIQTPLNTCSNSPFTFSSALSSAAPGDALTVFNWNFGDGNTSNAANPTHTYLAAATLPVILSVGSLQGCSASDTETITIASSALAAGNFSLTSPSSGFTGQGGNFTFSWNGSANAVNYVWQLSTDAAFTSIAQQSGVLLSNTYTATLNNTGLYYWRVLASNFCGTITASNIHTIEIFTPGNITTLAVWLRADTGLILTGGTVSQWLDASGNNLHASQSTSANAPSVVSSVPLLNNKPALSFDGNNDVLNGLTIPGIDATSSSVFVVTKGNAQSGVLAGIFNIGTLNNGMWFYRRMFTGRFTFINDFGNNTQVLDVPNSMPNTGFRYGLFGMVKNYGSESRLYLNSTGNAYSSNTALSGSFSNSNYVLGFGQGYSYYNGEIAEVIVYKKALSQVERSQVENYLYTKYAPPVNLGPDINNTYSVCPVTLNAGSRFLRYTWSTGDTVVSQINIKKSGTYWVSVTDVFGRSSSDTVVVNIPVSGTNFDDTAICSYDNVTLLPVLSASPYQFNWNTGANTSSIPIITSGDYFCLITDTNNCVFTTDTVSVTIDSFALQSLLPTDTNICKDNILAVDTGNYHPVYFAWNNNELGPSVTINNLGVISYSVTVTDINNCVAIDTAIVRANQIAPQIAFASSNLCFGDSAVFVNQTTQVGSDVINFYEWNFGDGVTNNDFSPIYLYNFPGTYPVTLTLATDSGCSGFLSKPIKVSAPPTANFTYPTVVCAGSTTTFFDNSAVILNDSVTSWLWTFGAADTSTLQIPSYEFNTQGVVNVQLIAATDVGCADTVTKTIEVFAPFQADFDFSNICSGDSTRFIDITNSLSVVDWLWNFGDGTPFSVTKNPTHYYTNTGTYTVIMKVENAIGCIDTLQKSVTVFRQPDAAINSLIACEDVVFSPKDTITTYGDPVVNKVWNINGVTYSNIPPQYFFTDTGTYPISLKVFTQNGCADSSAALLKVKANPTANFSIFPLYGEAPADIQFTNLSSGGITYQWDFGDANTSLDENPSHTFQYNDTFNIILTAISQDGCEASIQRAFVVAPTTLDVAASDVEVVKTAQLNNSVQVKVSAEIANIGTRVVTDMKLYATLGSGGVLSEDWNGILPSGQTLTYSFNAGFIVAEPNADTYVCVEAVSVNNGEEEVTTENNNDCASLTDGMQLLGPAPNPVMSVSALGIILPKAGEVTINIMDLYGRYYVRDFKANMPAGRTDYMLNRQQFAVGEYFVRVAYNDERLVRKFVVK